jgi:four helix bundle protein
MGLIQEKSFLLSKEIVLLYKILTKEKKEYVLSKQLLRSGTSVGANVSEGGAAQTKKDFVFKMNLSYKEAQETLFWLKLLKETGYLTDSNSRTALKLCEEVCRILCAILKTANNNLQEP